MSATIDQLPQSARSDIPATVSHEEVEPKGEEGDPMKLFSAVLANVRLDHLPEFVAAVRNQQDGPSDRINPVKVGGSVTGSYHILFPVEFGDGVRWLCKIPATGTRDRNARPERAIETTIPVPDIYAFDTTLGSELGVPFVLMRFIPGKSLYDAWFDKRISEDILEARRTRTLRDIAAAMVQEARSSSTNKAIPWGLDPRDTSTMQPCSHVLHRMMTDDPDERPIYFESGPYANSKAFYTSVLDHRPGPGTDAGKGELKLLRMFLEWIPEPKDGRKEFVLTYLSRTMGNERYPGWLTREWDPAMYGWTKEMEAGVEPEGLWEDSPQTLAFYRATYDRMMESFLAQEPGLESPISLVCNSFITENLYIAAENSMCTGAIMDKIFDTVAKLVGRGPHLSSSSEQNEEDEEEAFYIYSVTCALADGNLDER
ncbi:MAG: hypothetical protein M1816_001277 [Peltula sp. TS41687]|nr:MAG: hypothetical protein M1816_001277 [Peltula sp. TS41687]